jgi:integrase/recombinase XerD
MSIIKAFPNARGSTLSRDGVYILQLAVQRAAATCPSLASKRISPHTLRHSTAMHLLQSGVDITVIALWLGHESIETPTVTSKPTLL